MKNVIIKCHKSGTTYPKPHFYILNKGMNSGKPQKQPFQNCFVVLFEHQNDFDKLYFTAYCLWKTNFWHPFLIGSVIPFFRIKSFKTEFMNRVEVSENMIEMYNKSAATLKLLESKEKQILENLNRISEMKKLILYNFIKK